MTGPMQFRGRVGDRSKAILEGIRDGLTNAQIAKGLGLAANTVRTYVAGLYSDYDVSNRPALVVAAINANKIQPYTPKKKRA